MVVGNPKLDLLPLRAERQFITQTTGQIAWIPSPRGMMPIGQIEAGCREDGTLMISLHAKGINRGDGCLVLRGENEISFLVGNNGGDIVGNNVGIFGMFSRLPCIWFKDRINRYGKAVSYYLYW